MKIYKVTFLIAMTVMLLLGCSDVEKSQEFADNQAMPMFYSTDEIRIEDMNFNGVQFGDTRQDVISKIGEPIAIQELFETYVYDNYYVFFTEQDLACVFNIRGDDFAPYKDIRKGDNILSTLKKLPIPTSPVGIEAVYKEFTGDDVHDLNLLDAFFTGNTENPQMPGEPNHYYRSMSYYFDDNYILIFSYKSIKEAENDGTSPGIIDIIIVQTADAPSFED